MVRRSFLFTKKCESGVYVKMKLKKGEVDEDTEINYPKWWVNYRGDSSMDGLSL